MKTRSLVLLLLLCEGSYLQAQQEARVEDFSPQGVVKGVRQVRVKFSEPMVPFGDPRVVLRPFEIDCSAKGTARWADSKNWIYDFGEDLSAGVRCGFSVTEGLKTLSGTVVGGKQRFEFSTGGPAILSSNPPEGSESIDETQAFLLTLDGEAVEKSVLENVYFTVAGLADRVEVKILFGADRETILKSQLRYDQDALKQTLENPQRFPLVQARRRFPAGTKVSLVWGQGVASPSGVITDQDQVLPFVTRGPFTATFSCQRENAQADCIPIGPMQVEFSASVTNRQARRIVLRGAQGKTYAPKLSGESEDQESEEEEPGPEQQDDYVYGVTFQGPFPEKSSFQIELPPGIEDDAGRSLSNAAHFPLTVRTAGYPPLAKFAADFGILELNAEPMLPVTLRNIEPKVAGRLLQVPSDDGGGEPLQPAPMNEASGGLEGQLSGKILRVGSEQAGEILEWLKRLEQRGWNEEGDDRGTSMLGPLAALKAKKFAIPKLEGPKAFEVVGIPLRQPGFYVVEIESQLLGAALLGKTKPMYVPTAVLVTNLAVHFKWGIDSSLVWVTTLDRAKPVERATVQIFDCQGKQLWEGLSDEHGLARVQPLVAPGAEHNCSYSRYERGLMVTARRDRDMAFVHTSWDEGIEPWRFRLSTEYDQTLSIAHTVLDRALFRAGETVHMKHFLRRHQTVGLALAAAAEQGSSLTIQHVGSEQKYELAVHWAADGTAESTWAIPKEAKLGEYEVLLAKQAKDIYHPSSARFRVEEYRVPLMRGVIRPPAEPLVAPSTVPLDLTVSYLAGGGAGSLPIQFRYQLRNRSLPTFDGFEDFVFSAGPVREGRVRGGQEEDQEQQQSAALKSTKLTLDAAGSVRTSVTDLPLLETPREILTELEFRDPNGEVQTVSSRIPLWPARWQIGIRPESWALSRDAVRFQVAVVDLEGRPVSEAPVTVDLFQRKYYSHRKRLVGGFYAFESVSETKRVQSLCSGKTDPHGLLLCQQPAQISGNAILQAAAQDSEGRRIATHQDTWIAGGEEWWFKPEDGDRIDLLPEKRRYEPGETARFQVRMPFRSATALVTVEREGVAEAFVTELSGKEPVIELPVKGNYAPNVFVSVLVLRGRVDAPAPTATVDLARPAYKLGIAEINVGWKAHELKVKVSAERPVYKVRERAKVEIEVMTADGTPLAAGAEAAVAAVDEGLLELMPNRSWELLEAMMGRRGYGVQTATAQMQVIGKRHFGLKALPQGGGGGRQITRELFDTLLLWQGRVKLDPDGRARVEIPLNDSLTSFRIVAVACAGVDRFGTGATSIRSTQDLILFSGIAPLVRQGDRIRSEFTVRNATDSPMGLRVSARIQELSGTLAPEELTLGPGESREIGWTLNVPAGVEALHYELEAKAEGGSSDRLKVSQKVIAAVPVRVFQATLARVEPELAVEVERPQDALAGGGIRVELRPTLIQGLSGVADYMRVYPYSCLEQRVSTAIVLGERDRWRKIMEELPAYLDADGLAKYFPSMRSGSDTLTAYVLAIAHEAGREIPPQPRQSMLQGLRGFVEGTVSRSSSLPTVDLAIRKLAAVEALSRYTEDSEASNASSDEAETESGAGPIDAELLSSIAIEPNLWPTSALIYWTNILRRAKALPRRQPRLVEAERILRSRLNFQGTTMGFSTEDSDFLYWLMVSIDTNAARMLLTQLDSSGWKDDIPRLVRGALGRQRHGRWDTTVANAWGVLAMAKFSRIFEKTPVTGTGTATLAEKTQAVDWAASPQGKTLSFEWPAHHSALAIRNQGTGAPWATIQSLAAIPLREPFSSGYTIHKTLTAMEQKEKGVWSKGDIVRVQLELEAQADATWVVVNDPIPAGAAIFGTGLGRDSQLASEGEQREGWVWPVFEERSFEAYRAYYDFVPKGRWTTEYTLRLNSEGLLNLPPTRVEALYAPELFGEIPNQPIQIQ